jgi:hypothetical protein
MPAKLSISAAKGASRAAQAAGESKQGRVMATIASEPLSAPAARRDERSNPLAEILSFWRHFFVRAFNPYRPELHYMRGPGPAWRAKQMASSRRHSG